MQLAPILAKQFSTSVRERGYQYFRQQRVVIQYGTPSDLGAQVRGSELYQVLAQWSGSRLEVLCSCPYFVEEREPCKHLWAAILASDAQNYLSDAALAGAPAIDTGTLLNQLAPEVGAPARAEKAGQRAASASLARRTALVVPPPAPWKAQLSRILETSARTGNGSGSGQGAWPAQAEILYLVNLARSRSSGALVLSLEVREPKKQGGWKARKPLVLERGRIPALPDAEDRELLTTLAGGKQLQVYSYQDAYDRIAESIQLSPLLAQGILPKAIRTGRCFLLREVVAPPPPASTYIPKRGYARATVPVSEPVILPLAWDDGDPWKFVLEMRAAGSPGSRQVWELTGEFRRGDERMELAAALLVTPGGFLFTESRAARCDADAAMPWIAGMRAIPSIVVPAADSEDFLSGLLNAPSLPELELPESLRYEELTLLPRPCLKIGKPNDYYGRDRMRAVLTFDYGGRSVAESASARGFYNAAARQFLRRDLAAEAAAAALLSELGLRFFPAGWQVEAGWDMAASKLPRVVRALVEAGWHIVAEGKAFRRPGQTRVEVASGVDWFELRGEVEYGDAKAQLPQLLQALKRGETMVELDDGTFGLLPEEWLNRFGGVAAMGEAGRDHIRFGATQAGLLDALLATQPAVNCDETFARVRQELCRFESIAAADQPAGFSGQLREYQREGLGWMHFLRRFSFGGCLADDMGVGKTAQVLALLETRRELRERGEIESPSLAVVPKSLIFNWKQEAARFTPGLRLLDYTGIARKQDDFANCDLVLTTYGTLRRDALHFKDIVFDYVILDEAQAVKNAGTESAKAVRLLRGAHRLALSGTPVENHLGELWSLFEFLNPGMLGAAGIFQLAGGAMRNPGDETRKLLAHALRPFLLRRTKEQVAGELPAKIEQTIYCEMEPRQRTLYNDLRQHYRDSLLHKIGADGIAKSKLQVLEALLRLRQAACHPGLIDAKLAKSPSAKLDMLLDQLREVLDEGHKALVFSQFTSLLGILRAQLDARGIAYEYLDGKTHDRQARVEHFQDDPNCRLFLISLKAGGLGLNLTAADYVFILDPWWNPAVEAQAVDRTHRIGQTRQVFAYRLIVRDTVEEKVLQLQETKRNLADAILGAENSLIRDLRPEDIELLLS